MKTALSIKTLTFLVVNDRPCSLDPRLLQSFRSQTSLADAATALLRFARRAQHGRKMEPLMFPRRVLRFAASKSAVASFYEMLSVVTTSASEDGVQVICWAGSAHPRSADRDTMSAQSRAQHLAAAVSTPRAKNLNSALEVALESEHVQTAVPAPGPRKAVAAERSASDDSAKRLPRLPQVPRDTALADEEHQNPICS